MGVLFGTDGARGIANQELTPEIAFQLGRAGSHVFSREVSRPRILVGRDTRISGDLLESALVAGICSAGADVLKAGIIPTPGVAYLTQRYEASCGIVISASHNPAEFNGIKFFGPLGYKLPDEIEDEIERLVFNRQEVYSRPQGAGVGRVYEIEAGEKDYLEYLKKCYRADRDLSGMTVVVDCANGAAYRIGPKMWEEMGARVFSVHHQPDGLNINDRCGSTYPEGLCQAVVDCKADMGIAYDGDADRLIAVDEKGNVIDGDQVMVICGLHMHRMGALKPSKIVATVMSNIGLDIAFRKENIEVLSTQVGDRYVLEKMRESGARVGGEQSGHIIFLDHATTGDGLLSSLKLAEVVRETGLSLSVLASAMEIHPQLLINVEVVDKNLVILDEGINDSIRKAEDRLGETGKILVRPSGTEPKIRIMAQGPDKHLLQEVVDQIKAAVIRVNGQ